MCAKLDIPCLSLKHFDADLEEEKERFQDYLIFVQSLAPHSKLQPHFDANVKEKRQILWQSCMCAKLDTPC